MRSTPCSQTYIEKVRDLRPMSKELDGKRIRLYGCAVVGLHPEVEPAARWRSMDVPAQLFEAPLPVVAAYLRSIFQAEGFVSARDVRPWWRSI